MEKSPSEEKHFVLIHGSCHGAWCWYKVKPLLENAGHRVTALDMAGSGINMKRIDEARTLLDYSEPLIKFMETLGDDQKVILVGHSFGGFNLAVTMERFPHKIEVAVFLAAFMPHSSDPPSSIFTAFAAANQDDPDFWLDTEFKSAGDTNENFTTMFFGPKFLFKLYHLSPVEDYELGKTLARPASLFQNDLAKEETKFSKDKYGSVKRVYVVCEEDQGIIKSFQLWMAKNENVEIKELKGADHMPMFCMPQNLCDCLLEIADH